MTLSESLASGIITVLNGLWAIVGAVLSPITIIVVLTAVSFAWLALLENDELDRQATKPQIGVGQ